MEQAQLGDLAHIGVIVSDLQKTVKFYTELLGFHVVHENEIRGEAGTVHIAFVSNGNLTLEFLQLPESRGAKGGTVDHVAIKVHGIDTVAEELKKAGICFDTEEVQSLPHFWERGTRWLTFKGPDGEKLEISEVL